MNDCYWGGPEDRYYYEVDSGRIIGQIIANSDQIYKAFYFDAWNNPGLGDYIDDDRARKAVERCRKQDVEVWEKRRAVWNAPVVEETPVQEPMKSWWKIWE